MSGITRSLYDLYIRFLVWLGAAPPEGYENLLPPEEAGLREYTLQKGDTLYAVARKFGVHYDRIVQANGLTDPADVQPGQTVAIPPAAWNPNTDPPYKQLKAIQPDRDEEASEAMVEESLLLEDETGPEAVGIEEVAPPEDDEVEPFLPREETTGPPDEEPLPLPDEPDWLWQDEAVAETDEIVEQETPPPDLSQSLPEPDATTIPVDETDETLTVEMDSVAEAAEIVAPLTPESSIAADDRVEEAFDSEALPAETTAEEMLFRYELQRGDTLNGIAKRYGVTLRDLIDVNNITNPNRIYPGQKLIIPGYDQPPPQPDIEPEPEAPLPQPPSGEFITHSVVRGDTLSSIAKRYGVTLRHLVEINHIEDPGLLRLGQRLLVPGVVAPAPPAELVEMEDVAPSEPSPEAEILVEPPPQPEPETIAAPQSQREPQAAPEPTVEIDPHFPPIGPLQAIRALYLSYFAIGHVEINQHILDLLHRTELNTVVIDIKGDHGLISYPTGNLTAREIGADRSTARNFSEIIDQFRSLGVYLIGRIVVFKDDPLAKAYPELAIKTTGGGLWQDHEQSAWSDPFLKPVWDYNIQLAIEATHLGFHEVHFDYLRFPFASQAGEPYFSQDISKETRVAALTGFLSVARGQLQPLGVKLGAKTFGYTCWRKDDSLIGQDIDRLAQYLDVLSPMLAPSTFGSGIPGYKMAIAHPYEVVHESAKRAVARVAPFNCAVRPWIQDFPDYRFDKRTYGKDEIQAQIKGCFDAGSEGYLVWSPRVEYTSDAYAPLKKIS